MHVLGEEMGPEELKEALQVGWLELTCVCLGKTVSACSQVLLCPTA